MKLTEHVYLIGSGYLGFDMTDPYDCHVFLIESNGELALVDTGAGMGVSAIIRNLEQHGFHLNQLKYVLLTHAHADHAGGAADLKQAAKQVQIVSSHEAADLLEKGDEDGIHLTAARAAGIYPSDYRLKAFSVDIRVREADVIQLGSLTIKVLETPGHCSTHISYYVTIKGKNVLFAGDTIFYDGKIHLINTQNCNLQQYSTTAQKLAQLDVDVLLPGHLMPSLTNGKRHLEMAAYIFRNLGVPEKIV
jgi:hydroxyacylglutathione hydrolase